MAVVEPEQSPYTRIFAKVFQAELAYIQHRRKNRGLDARAVQREINRLSTAIDKQEHLDSDKHPDLDEGLPRFPVQPNADVGLVGLALSGGGIRSATFNLGLLQALAKRGILRYCDYLSTVSGGGYIGSCLSSLLDNPDTSVEEDEFPFRFERDKKPDERKEVKWLRKHGNFIALDRSVFSLDIWRMIGLYLSGLVLTNFVSFAIVVLLAYVVHLIVRGVDNPPTLAIQLLIVALFAFGLMVVVRAFAAMRNLAMDGRRWRGYAQGILALVAAGLATLGGVILLAFFLPQAQSIVTNQLTSLLNGVSIVSVLGLLVGLLKSENERLQKVFRIVYKIAWVAIIPVLAAQLVRWLWATDAFDQIIFGWLPTAVFVALVLLVLSLFINTNRISLHHFYRDRLSEAYVIKRVPKKNARVGDAIEEVASNEKLELADLHARENGAPYQLINTTLNVPDSKNRYLRGRGADFFVFSQLYCGGESTGYRRTDEYGGGDTRLATAMAISGAAASPQMGTSTSRVLTFLMTLLNVRLNRWMPNPDPSRTPTVKFWPYYFVKELFGKGKETDRLLNLSDGGHHENLGIYSLIKRGCRFIIASDAGADPAFRMEDLANLLRKVRIDLGVDIKIRLDGLRPQTDPQTKTRHTPQYYAVGTIDYPSGGDGVLVYIKTTVTGNEPEDLLAYERQNPSFPDESTADQFFDEAQFESYRKLGELIGKEVFSEDEVLKKIKKKPGSKDFAQELFESIRRRYIKFLRLDLPRIGRNLK